MKDYIPVLSFMTDAKILTLVIFLFKADTGTAPQPLEAFKACTDEQIYLIIYFL
jgi:hypothetical protein